MRPEPIDSMKQLLSGPHILMEFASRYDSGKYPLHVAIAAMAQELSMDDAEVIQFGNTAFISHYNFDDAAVFMRALNVDTAANFVDNIENYVAYVYKRAVKTIVTTYNDATISTAIKAVKRRIEATNKNIEAEVTFKPSGSETVATIKLVKEG